MFTITHDVKAKFKELDQFGFEPDKPSIEADKHEKT
jgi:hypothetical protein